MGQVGSGIRMVGLLGEVSSRYIRLHDVQGDNISARSVSSSWLFMNFYRSNKTISALPLNSPRSPISGTSPPSNKPLNLPSV